MPVERICAKPMIELGGVRNSWLIFARKSDLVRFASSASSLAMINAASMSLRSEISIAIVRTNVVSPDSSMSGVLEVIIRRSSFLTKIVSSKNGICIPVAKTCVSIAVISSLNVFSA